MEEISTYVSIIVGLSTVVAIIIVPLLKENYNYQRNKDYLYTDYQEIKKLKKLSIENRKILVLLLNHMIDGNNIKEMKETRKRVILSLEEEKEK